MKACSRSARMTLFVLIALWTIPTASASAGGMWTLLAGSSQGTPITAAFPSFNSGNLASFQLNGSAALSGTALRLTPAQGSSAGSAFWENRVSLKDNRSFSTYFTFNMAQGSSPPADGFTFCIQPESNNAGSVGGGLGYAGIANSLGIEFDTYFNVSGDPNANHVGIDLNGSAYSVVTAIPAFTMYGGTTVHTWIDYDGAAKQLEVRVSQGAARPSTALIAYSVDLSESFGPEVFAGFTAATGGSYETHDISSWYFNNDYLVGGITPASTSYVMGPAQIVADTQADPLAGFATRSVGFTVYDANGLTVSGESITFSAPLGGSLDVTSGVSDSSGRCTVVYRAPNTDAAFSVRASTDAGVFGEAGITVFAVAEPLAPVSSDRSYTVPEGSSSGTLVGSVAATDPGDLELVYDIVSGDTGGVFEVDSAGRLVLATVLPALGDTPTYSLGVRATNTADKSSIATVDLRVVNVPAGSGSAVTLGEVVLRFDSVGTPGVARVTPLEPRHQAPETFSFVPGAYYDITTDAEYTGMFTVTLSYDPALVEDPSALRILHYHEGAWEVLESTVDIDAHTVSAQSSSFSDYALGEGPGAVSTPASSPWSTLLILVFAGFMVLAARFSKRSEKSAN